MFFNKPYNKNLPKFDIEGKNSMLTKGLSPNGEIPVDCFFGID